MKRNNPVCVRCGRQISKDALKRGEGRVLEQVNGVRQGEHVAPDCASKSLKELRETAAVAQG